MSSFEKKTLRIDLKAIKVGIILVLGLVGSFFVIREVSAETFFFEEDFETYNVADITGQGYWKQVTGFNSFEVSTTTAKSGIKSLGYDLSGFGNGNLKDGVGIATSTHGSFSFWFKVTSDVTNQKIIFTLTDDNVLTSPARYNNSAIQLSIHSQAGITLFGTNTTSTPVAVTTPLNSWEKIEIEYDFNNDTLRALLYGSFWSDYIPLRTDVDYINTYFVEGGDTVNPFYLDNIEWTTGDVYFPSCGFSESCQFCNTSTTCAYYNCIWYENWCWNTPPPVLPGLEDCSVMGLTDRLICEIKNFAYRLFVPSNQKIVELQDKLNLIKQKFPYNYILATKDFFVYLKDNINDEQEISLSVFGQAGIVNFEFWNTTTSVAGSTQTFLDIIKKFFSLLVILMFIIWCFSFFKKIFK